jgi:hypothetical protein
MGLRHTRENRRGLKTPLTFNLCRTQIEFSEAWLGQCGSYFAAIRSTSRSPCLEARWRLFNKLGVVGAQMTNDSGATPDAYERGRELLLLASKGVCLEARWLDASVIESWGHRFRFGPP